MSNETPEPAPNNTQEILDKIDAIRDEILEAIDDTAKEILTTIADLKAHQKNILEANQQKIWTDGIGGIVTELGTIKQTIEELKKP